jgi:uncharacterized protein
MKRILIGFLLALCLYANSSHGQQTSTHDQAALEFLNAVGMEKVLQEISSALVDNLIRSNPPLAPRRDVMVEWAKKYLTWEAAASELIKIYKGVFTETELREIIAFYRTSTGQKLATRLPELMRSGAQVGGAIAGAHLRDLEQMLRERSNPQGGTPPPAPVPQP